MKKSFLQFHALVLGALLISPLLAQTVSPENSKAAEPHDSISVARAENGELADERIRLEDARRRLHDENNPEVLMHRDRVEKMEKNQRWLVNLDFPGGSLSKLLATISKAHEVSFNIISAGNPTDLATEMPPFSLRNAPLATVAEVIHQLLYPRGLDLKYVGGETNSVVCVVSWREMPDASKHPPATEFESFQLAPYLAEQSVDDIVGAIRTAWELDPAHDRAALHVKFHPGTSILLVSGPHDGISLALSVIVSLKRAPEQHPKVSPKNPPPEAEQK